MSDKSAQLTLAHALALCTAHAQTLQEALGDLEQADLDAAKLERLTKPLRRLLDQFAYRFTRLQDDFGARLMPAVLKALGEDIAPMPVLDRIARLEQLEWLESAEEWVRLRQIRNEFTHDYPESTQDRHARLKLAMDAARRLILMLDRFARKTEQRFGQF